MDKPYTGCRKRIYPQSIPVFDGYNLLELKKTHNKKDHIYKN